MPMRRRESLFLIAAAFAGLAAQRPPPVPRGGPALWRIERNRAQGYILGVGDVKDATWLTPRISSALDHTLELWLETAQPDPTVRPTNLQQRTSLQLEKSLGYEDDHDLFEALGPELSARVLAAAERLGVARADLRTARAWMAATLLERAYWAKRAEAGAGLDETPSAVLAGLARANRKPVHAAIASGDDLTRRLAGMAPDVQRERLAFLLDDFDDARAGDSDRYAWTTGHASSAALERMRTRYPQLYQLEHIEGGLDWAHRIDGLVSRGGVYVFAVDVERTLGPDNLLDKLRDHGFLPEPV
ncbi:TraB/GumN family protein [Phenylobacterium sp.]|uniref:TraB/GumN family protein n=1 Tax=Phenylobacterium sp. TaxID=1871053 RepID=UPI0011FEEB7E|nr:TraB/GumN family protein [Phenylobacterium sp.]THD62587.1 MAG: TraB/GumN family protein [Phenylobacterium sp.]